VTALSEAIVRDYDVEIPGVHDPHHTTPSDLVRHMLSLTDLAMRDEGLDHAARRRVLLAITTGRPTPPTQTGT
jgi:hypothetical protein